jgi:hypothetical protein
MRDDLLPGLLLAAVGVAMAAMWVSALLPLYDRTAPVWRALAGL